MRYNLNIALPREILQRVVYTKWLDQCYGYSLDYAYLIKLQKNDYTKVKTTSEAHLTLQGQIDIKATPKR